jgi:hypothetical protein
MTIDHSETRGIGQNFDDFLKEEGIYDEVNELAERKIKELNEHNQPSC